MLVKIRGSSGCHGLRNPHFHEHQSGTQFDREAASPYEPEAVTKQWARRNSKTMPDAGESGLGPDHVKTRSRERKGREVRPSPLTPQGASPENEEAHPGGAQHRQAPQPVEHHGNGDTEKPPPEPRHRDEPEHVGGVLERFLKEQAAP
jgi:hypothetical protein